MYKTVPYVDFCVESRRLLTFVNNKKGSEILRWTEQKKEDGMNGIRRELRNFALILKSRR